MSEEIRDPDRVTWPLRLLGVVGILFGLSIAIPGLQLIVLGGSWYYLIAGALTAYAGVKIYQGYSSGITIYLAVCALTIIWGLYEVAGMEQWFWPLIPRWFAFGFALFFILLAAPLFPDLKEQPDTLRLAKYVMIAVLVCMVLTIYGMFLPHGVVRNAFKSNPDLKHMNATKEMGKEWRDYGSTGLGNRFQAADQINRESVKKLKVAWVYRTGKKGFETNADQNTPVFANNTVYACTYDNQVHAIDGETGKRKWMFDPKASAPFFMRCRGLAYYKAPSPDADGKCANRIILSTIDTRLIALDADTGVPCKYFGTNGTVDMKRGIGDFKKGMYGFTSAAAVVMDTIILGGFLNDNISTYEPSGVIRAMDAVTGELRWAFDVGRPGQKGWPKDGETFTKGTPNMWTHAAFDKELGLVYLPLGSATPDVYGGKRRPFDDKYGASVVALDIKTGDERWRFQTVHRDLWDFDLPSQPSLYDVVRQATGQVVKVIVIPTKRQDIFMLDRETGEPVAEVVEKKVETKSEIPEHKGWLSPTQPYSVGMPKVGGNTLTGAHMWGATPIDQLSCRIRFKKVRYAGNEFVPPSTEPAFQQQGPQGGFNWGAGSIDENSGIYIINDLRLPITFKLVPRRQTPDYPKLDSGHAPYAPQFGTPYGLKREPLVSWLGLLCHQPPWGTISGIDLNSQKLVWSRPIGTLADLDFLGINSGLQIPIGMPSLGGSVITGGGVAFIGTAMDRYFRALDTRTGETLWKDRMPVGATATPISYVANNGKQYVVISAGGSTYAVPKARGDYVIAYALP